jgi:hypothetical protein
VAEDGEASAAEPASAALIAVANSFGFRYPKPSVRCGFVVLDPPGCDLPDRFQESEVLDQWFKILQTAA